MYEPLLTRLPRITTSLLRIIRGSVTAMRRRQVFSYTFDHIAQVMEHFTEALRLDRYALYFQDMVGRSGSGSPCSS